MTGRNATSADNSWTANPFAKWLLTDGWTIAETDDLVTQLAFRLTDSGVALHRLRIVIRTLHPLVFGEIFSWSRDSRATEVLSPTHDVLETAAGSFCPVWRLILVETGWRSTKHPIFVTAALGTFRT